MKFTRIAVGQFTDNNGKLRDRYLALGEDGQVYRSMGGPWQMIGQEPPPKSALDKARELIGWDRDEEEQE